MSWYADPAVVAVVAGAVGAATGAALPRVLARLPEPEPDPADTLEAAADEADFARPVDEPKELYADLAARPGLAWQLAVGTALVSALLGARLGWQPALATWLYLAPLGVALGLVDWRTRYLPKRLIVPSYAVVATLVVLSALATADWAALRLAALGWLGTFALYFVLWFVSPRSMAYGDVRLAGLLGMALGWLGPAHLLVGVVSGFVLLAVGGLLLSVVRIFHRRHVPFGPFMLTGALLGATFPFVVGGAYAGLVNAVTGLLLRVFS